MTGFNLNNNNDIELMLTENSGNNSGFSFIVSNVGGIDHRHFYHLQK
jgi:hypothetical protein